MPRTLGDGQVAASATAIYTAVSANSPSGERVSLSFCNTAATSETLVVTCNGTLWAGGVLKVT